jgi:uncharacterized LabA/DUF88 family protein
MGKTSGKPAGERVAIFIDGSNFYHSLKDSSGFHENEVDFGRVAEILRDGRMLIGVFYYNAPLDRSYNEDVYWKQQKFFSNLRRIPGFNIVLCTLRKRKGPDGRIEYKMKGDDIHLAIDMLSLAYENSYDTAVIVSGDGDFVPAIRRVQKLGKRVENAYFSISRSDFMRKVCDKSVRMEDFIEDCIRKV